MRGKHGSPTWEEGIPGITPADAGKTYLCIPARRVHLDHPRGCGENANYIPNNFKDIGSPPRMRGKRWNSDRPAKSRGITPADAGKTRTRVPC